MSPEEQINDLSAKLGAARDERDRQRDEKHEAQNALIAIEARALAAPQEHETSHPDEQHPRTIVVCGRELDYTVATIDGPAAYAVAELYGHAQGDILSLVAEVRRLRAIVAQLAPPDVTPLTEVQRRNLDAMMARDEGPGAPCEDRPGAGPTRMEIVEAQALARAAGNTAAVNAARLAARVWRRYDRERDRVRELSAVLESVREAVGCETWVECPERVRGLRAEIDARPCA